MRVWPLLALAAAGCGVPRPPDVTPQASAVDPAELATRLAGLRATLARNHVELDTASEIASCGGDGYHDSGERRCVRCEVASAANTMGVDLGLIDGVAIAFALYPPAMFRTARVEHVALCRAIRFDGAAPDEQSPAGVAIPAEHRVLISVEQFADGAPLYRDFSIEQVVHHEMFHLFDHATSGEHVYDDRAWNALNPPGFVYRDPAGDARPRGFVNRYATTNELEDRASVFELLLGQPDRLCEFAHGDPVIAAKTAAVWRRVAKVVVSL